MKNTVTLCNENNVLANNATTVSPLFSVYKSLNGSFYSSIIKIYVLSTSCNLLLSEFKTEILPLKLVAIQRTPSFSEGTNIIREVTI